MDKTSSGKGYVIVAITYLLGLFIGALDMGIITPGRTIIQGDLGVDDSLGVWIITIYTLAYAASIPIMGKLADRMGRKYVYLTCIVLFGTGSLLCGLSHSTGSFWMLIVSRAIQALGGGGIMPIATAEIGTAFPEEKRGIGLGLVGAVYGVASVFGASAGSLILDICGQHNWQYIFYINVPICVIVAALGIVKLPNTRTEGGKRLDIAGILVMTIMILSLMYFLKTVDFFDFRNSITDIGVWPFLVAFLVLVPVFILIERHAADPVINLSYFKNRDIVITLVCSICSGVILMGNIFLPQFCENALFMESGAGGYFIIILGLFCGIGSPVSGMLIDRFGVKMLLGAGFAFGVAGALFTAFVACAHPSLVTVVVALALTGVGMGFTMGTPINYMMLQKTDPAESNSALAMLSLVRSMGTAVAPAIMVAFIVHAGAGMQDQLMEVMPKQVTVSPLPYAQELDDELDEMRSDANLKKMLKGIDIPKLTDYEVIDVDMDAEGGDFDVEISDEIIDELSASDVTTVVAACKDMAVDVFAQVKPQLIEDATGGLEDGLATMEKKAKKMRKAIKKMTNGIAEMDDGLADMDSAIAEMDDGLAGIDSGIAEMNSKIATASSNIKEMNAKIDEMDASLSQMQDGIDQMTAASAEMQTQLDGMMAAMGEDAEAVVALKAQIEEMDGKVAELQKAYNKLAKARAKVAAARDGISAGKEGMESGRSDMYSSRDELSSGKAELTSGRSDLTASRAELADSRAELKEAYAQLKDTIAKLKEVDAAIPGLFEEAQTNYLAAIDDNAEQIQLVYQTALDEGFTGMFSFTAVCCALSLLALLFFREERRPAKSSKGAKAQ